MEPDEEDFATLVLGELTTDHHLLLLNCGHPAPLLIGPDSVQQLRLEKCSPPIGLAPQARPLRAGTRTRANDCSCTRTVSSKRASETAPSTSMRRPPRWAPAHSTTPSIACGRTSFASSAGRLDDDTTMLLAQLTD